MAEAAKSGERPAASERSQPEHEALLAQAALAATMRKLRRDLVRTVEPTVWARHYPWAMLGLSTLTGFAAGAVAAKPPHFDAAGRARMKRRWRQGRRVLSRVLAVVMPAVRAGRAAARRFASDPGSTNGHTEEFGDW